VKNSARAKGANYDALDHSPRATKARPVFDKDFSRSLLRLDKFSLENCAILRNTLRKRNDELPSGSNGMQSSETMRNSLGLNYKSAALNQLSYAGVPHTKLFSAS
jgi:hypothetical protein